jgi:SAM-dependent methyltransferase
VSHRPALARTPRSPWLSPAAGPIKETVMTTIVPTAPDLLAVKNRQRQTWASGDYAAVGARILLIAEQLIDAADLAAGSTVLDMATGSGNAALAAARAGCVVTGVDYVPELLGHGRRRASAEGLDVEFIEGDAEALPFADASFDAVVSTLGVMFTADQDAAAAELLRVSRPGATIALANWTPSSFVGDMLRTVARHAPPPAGVRSPLEWGTEPRLIELLGDGVSELLVRPRTFVFRFRSPVEFVDFFRANYGPVNRAFAGLDDAGRARLGDDLAVLAATHGRPTGRSLAIPSEYLEVIAARRD